jgi:DNA-binding transcriptional MerR regulator
MAETPLIGIGLYTVPEAARLTGISVPRIRRWLAGYRHGRGADTHASAPLWHPEVPKFGSKVELSFRDLMELRFVHLFLEQGLSLQAIRRAIQKAVDVFGIERPLSTQRFRTDGRSIFLEVAGEIDEPRLFDLKRDQYLFHRMVAPSFKDIDFEKGIPVRWWPLAGRKAIVLDPKRSFGKPILARSGVPAAALADAYQVRHSFKQACLCR